MDMRQYLIKMFMEKGMSLEEATEVVKGLNDPEHFKVMCESLKVIGIRPLSFRVMPFLKETLLKSNAYDSMRKRLESKINDSSLSEKEHKAATNSLKVVEAHKDSLRAITEYHSVLSHFERCDKHDLTEEDEKILQELKEEIFGLGMSMTEPPYYYRKETTIESEYKKLIAEAKSLRAYSVEDFIKNVPARAEVKRKAERALTEGKITEEQYRDIERQVQEGIQQK